MKSKRVLAGLLAAAAVAGCVQLTPALAAGSASSFSDITDASVAEAAEFLRMMGVVSGKPGGAFDPTGTLTRAEFCKMVVTAQGRGDEEPSQRGRTIYLDVGPGYWARGYINLASTSTATSGGGSGDGDGDKSGSSTPAASNALVGGVGNGTFQPDRPITYGEAVTILCRVLGYDVASAGGGDWFDGAMASASTAGLTDDLTLSGWDTLTRSQAATLFYNLYFSKPKGSTGEYLVSLGGKVEDSGVLLDVNAVADDGSSGAVQTTKTTYKTDRAMDPSMEGLEGKAVLDKDGKLLSFQPKTGTSQKTYSVSTATATEITAVGGAKLSVDPDAKAYQDGKETTYDKVYLNLKVGAPVVFHYGANGKLAYLFFPSAAVEDASSMVAKNKPNGSSDPFSSLAKSGNYVMYKNGALATAADIRQYDTAVWDASTGVMRISDLKLTGVYEAVKPSPESPVTVKVMGKEFPVLPSARGDMSSFKVGSRVTLLLTAEGTVAGAIPPNTASGGSVGIATVSKNAASVKLLGSDITVTGELYGDADSNAARYGDKLVTVSSNSVGKLSLSVVTGRDAVGALDVGGRKLGDKTVADNVKVYDRVGDSAMVAVDYADISNITVPNDKIGFVQYDWAGRVSTLVLNDVTGDAYSYGYLAYVSGDTEKDEDGKVISVSPSKLSVRQGDSKGNEITAAQGTTTDAARTGIPGGVAVSGSGKVAAWVQLQSFGGVSRSAFDADAMTLTRTNAVWPVADNVQCYNKTTQTWFAPGKEGLNVLRAYSDNISAYYDKAIEDGGKIRMLIVE